MNIEREVCHQLENVLGEKRGTVNVGQTLVGDLRLDSLDLLEMAMCLEDEFGIEIDDSEAEKMKTVGDVVAMVAKKKGLN